MCEASEKRREVIKPSFEKVRVNQQLHQPISQSRVDAKNLRRQYQKNSTTKNEFCEFFQSFKTREFLEA